MSVFNRILIPTDGSDYSMIAVEKGLRLAKEIGAEVTVLHVIDNRLLSYYPSDPEGFDIASKTLKEESEQIVNLVKEKGEEMGVPITTLIKEGSPGWIISTTADEFDLVVIATLGRTGISRILIGSVAERVARHSNSPVMLVKAP
jgi:nucleotide-binding universal stress UspA family protein